MGSDVTIPDVTIPVDAVARLDELERMRTSATTHSEIAELKAQLDDAAPWLIGCARIGLLATESKRIGQDEAIKAALYEYRLSGGHAIYDEAEYVARLRRGLGRDEGRE